LREENSMNNRLLLANAVLWAAAIIASSIVGAPTFLSLVLLPSLAAISLLLNRPGRSSRQCDA
jgi:hypothetical protein